MQSMNKVVEQVILKNTDVCALENNANSFYKSEIGWEPLGPVVPISVKDAEKGTYIVYIQTLIRRVVA